MFVYTVSSWLRSLHRVHRKDKFIWLLTEELINFEDPPEGLLSRNFFRHVIIMTFTFYCNREIETSILSYLSLLYKTNKYILKDRDWEVFLFKIYLGYFFKIQIYKPKS